LDDPGKPRLLYCLQPSIVKHRLHKFSFPGIKLVHPEPVEGCWISVVL